MVDYPRTARLRGEKNNDDTSDDNSFLDYNKPNMLKNRDFVLLLLLHQSSSCAPSYTDCKDDYFYIQSGLKLLELARI